MTALEAAASTRTRKAIIEQAAVIDHVSLSDKLVRDILLGWPSRADNRRIVLDAAQVCGVDVATIPAHSPAEVAEWKERRRGERAAGPCPECERQTARIEELDDIAAGLRASVVEHRRRADDLAAERDAARAAEATAIAERDQALARVAELEAQLAAERRPATLADVLPSSSPPASRPMRTDGAVTPYRADEITRALADAVKPRPCRLTIVEVDANGAEVAR